MTICLSGVKVDDPDALRAAVESSGGSAISGGPGGASSGGGGVGGMSAGGGKGGSNRVSVVELYKMPKNYR